MKVDPRFLTEDGPEVFVGNELLLKGALEVAGGVHLLAGYPGSPVASFFDAFAQVKDLLNARGVRAVINNNEALAAAMLNGSQVVGCRGMIVMKSVGVHVAADALALGNQSGAHPEGGAVVVYGDDPWSDSTQVPSDSRYISKHLFIPTIEPSTPQEIKDFVDLAFTLSRESELYAGYILTNNLADGGGSVDCRPNQFPEVNTLNPRELATKKIDLDKFVLLPPRTWWQEEAIAPRFERAIASAARLGLNRLEAPVSGDKAEIGFVSSGLAYSYLTQALAEMDQAGRFPILKLGMTYPVAPDLVRQLAGMCKRIVVVEERRGFIEEQIAQILLRDRQDGLASGEVELWGKKLPFGLPGLPETRGLHPSIVINRLAPLLAKLGQAVGDDPFERELAAINTTAEAEVGALPPRLPSFCPGCPHRDTASLCLEVRKRFRNPVYMRKTFDCDPVDLIFHGDTGCYTMLMFPPNEQLMHDYSGMGLGGGTGAGVDPFVTNKQVVFMGDSTFFHSGQIAISQALKLGQDITFIILDNRTTAMTGHQPAPNVDFDILGNPTPVQNIEDIVHGIAAEVEVPIARFNPEHRQEYRKLLEQTFLADGVKVIIADKECGITRIRRQRREQRAVARDKGYLPKREVMNINAEICRFCLACSEFTGCPGLRHVETDYGKKMATDLSWCVNDGACERIGACWSFERLTIKRHKKPRSLVPELGLDEIPEPQKRPAGEIWHGYLAGVGGMGIGLATSILVRAGHKDGWHVWFTDKKGLAIRNGGVNSQVVFYKGDRPVSGTIGFGKADLIIGVDVLEAARAMDPTGRMRVAAADRTAAVINTHKIATIAGVMGKDDFDPDALEQIIRKHTRSDDYLARDISRICEKYLGSKIYANIMMLGFAFQKGLIPVSMHAMAWAIKDAIRADHRKNLYAFNMGRKLVESPELFQGAPQRTGWAETLDQRCMWTIRRYGKNSGMDALLRELSEQTIEAISAVDEPLKRDLIVRLYDCMRWGGIEYARRYAGRVRKVFDADSAEEEHAATRAVVHKLAEAMLIKDWVFIAELATSPEKYARDRDKYNVTPALGDRISRRFLLPTTLSLFKKTFRVDFTVPSWVFQILKRNRWLRKFPSKFAKGKQNFLTRYEQKVDQFAWDGPAEYQRQLTMLSSSQCMKCLNPRCQDAGCPLESRIPEWIDFAYQQNWQAACERIHKSNNFPEFTGMLCPAPCQSQCKHAINKYPVQIRSIESEIVERGFENGWIVPQPAARKTGRQVAVVGSGPAGLAAAQQLVREGHDVTVFERDDQPGGLLRYGIPDFRMDKKLLDRRLDQLRGEGVKFRTNADVGRDISAAHLREQFDAIVLAVGATRPRDLNVPGRELTGVHYAMDYLRQQNRRQLGQVVDGAEAIHARDKVVVVLGGGETGSDCVETALKQGAREVHQYEILPESDVNGDPTHAPPKAVKRRWSVATKAFEGNGHGLKQISGVEVKWVGAGDGRRMQEVPDTEFTQPAELVLLATGFDVELPPSLVEQFSLQTGPAGRVAVDDGQTSAEGVFAAGDAVEGPSLIVKAIRSGRQAAEQANAWLGLAVTTE